ncbi:MAG: peroxiredoxin [Gammaproteobacteria bacterium]|nr:MAG: peroxiredoxin [Gammaproteobacteria bacterium]
MEVGSQVPALQAQATSDTLFDTEALKGRPWIIYFYPKDNTPGCTQEGQEFRDHYESFKALGCEIFGVSRDSLRTHENFRARHGFPFELVSDPDEIVCKAFDVIKLKKNYGREYMGIERSTFLVSAEGVVLEAWRKVRVKGHVDAVLEAARRHLS